MLAAWMLAALFPAVSSAEPANAKVQRFARSELHMGVEFEVVVYAADAEVAKMATGRAFVRVAALDKALSDYDLESELSRLSATSTVADSRAAAPAGGFPAVKLSDDLWTVLSFSQEVSEKSGGAFDMTVGPLTKLWRRARRQKALPEPELFNPAKAAVGYRFLQLDAMERTARLRKPNMRLDLGGIAKGFAADEALAEIKRLGIAQALVRASGDIAAGDPPPGEAGWLVGIAPLDPDEPPTRFVRLANMAVSTSGDSRQHLEIDGQRYSHIVDPRTGLGVLGKSSVTVIAARGIAADSLATAVSILGPDQGLDLVAKYKGAALLMVADDGKGNLREVASPSFGGFEIRPLKE
ncbi:MAG TPA: FAD:protein FMN transferase [Pirellulaceae bacterium]|nr:FAD:protein FMN transferase [Pirellulaceae bacterium]